MVRGNPVPARNIKPWLWLAGAIIALDQVSKWIVLGVLQVGDSRYVAPFFNWVLTFNPGAAFSFLSDAGGWQRWFFTVLALGVSAWIVGMLSRHSGEFRLSLALSLILGGALGNVLDRCGGRFRPVAHGGLLFSGVQCGRFGNHHWRHPAGLGSICRETLDGWRGQIRP